MQGSTFGLPSRLLWRMRILQRHLFVPIVLAVTQISREYNHPVIEITECGCCYMDTPYEKEGGRVPDERRTAFFKGILAELARAIADDTKVRAFHAWSLMDNFEWTDGYSQRYGLTYVDFRDQKRTVKDSGLWYGRVAGSNRLAL